MPKYKKNNEFVRLGVPPNIYVGNNFTGVTNSNMTGTIDDNITSTVKPVDRDKATLEAEVGEAITKPNLTGLYRIGGKTHERGGTPLAAEPGSFIFSNSPDLAFTKDEKELFKFKLGGTHKPKNNTPAKVLFKEVDPKEYNRLMSIIDDPKSDRVAKETAALMLTKYQEKMGKVALLQELKKNEQAPDFAVAPEVNPALEFAENNQEMFRNGGLVKFEGGGQGGSKKPIITNDPHDPRLKAYNDSLSVYNKGLQLKNRQVNTINTFGITPEEWLNIPFDKKQAIEDRRFKGDEGYMPTLRNDKILPVSMTRPVGISSDNIDMLKYNTKTGTPVYINHQDYKYMDDLVPQYKKPTQPIVYQKTPPIGHKNVDASIVPQPNVRGYNQMDAQGQPLQSSLGKATPYSFTWMDNNSPNQQSSQYFDNVDQWRSFIKDNPNFDIQGSEEGKDYATARGYKKMANGGKTTPMNIERKGGTEYDSIPSYLYYVKAAQDGNKLGMSQAINHITNYNGADVATGLQLLAKSLKNASLNDIAKRNVTGEQNPEMKKLYSMINENPDIINKFDYSMPDASIAKFDFGGENPPDKTGKWAFDYINAKGKKKGWNAMRDFQSPEDYAQAVGFQGNPQDIGALQQHVMDNYPQLVNYYHGPQGYGMPVAGTWKDGKLGVRWNDIGRDIRTLKSAPRIPDNTTPPPLVTNPQTPVAPTKAASSTPIAQRPWEGFDFTPNSAEMLSIAAPYLTALSIKPQYDSLIQANTTNLRLDRVDNNQEVADMNQRASTEARAAYQNTNPIFAKQIAAQASAQAMQGEGQSDQGIRNANTQIANQETQMNAQRQDSTYQFNLGQIQQTDRNNKLTEQRRDYELANAATQSLNNGMTVSRNLEQLGNAATMSAMPYVTNQKDANGNDLVRTDENGNRYTQQGVPFQFNKNRRPVFDGSYGSLNSFGVQSKSAGNSTTITELQNEYLSAVKAGDTKLADSIARGIYALSRKDTQVANSNPFASLLQNMYSGLGQ